MKRNNFLPFLLCGLVAIGCGADDAAIPPSGAGLPVPVQPKEYVGFLRETLRENAAYKKVLIDASRDGGVWWFPQTGAFGTGRPHQGLAFETLLKETGFTVEVLPPGARITDELLEKFNVILRVNGCGQYTPDEVAAYKKALDRGVSLLLFSDHHKYDYTDALAPGVDFKGILGGNIRSLEAHELVNGVTDLEYVPGARRECVYSATGLAGQ